MKKFAFDKNIRPHWKQSKTRSVEESGSIVPYHKKTCFSGFRQGPTKNRAVQTQTIGSRLEISDLENRGIVLSTSM